MAKIWDIAVEGLCIAGTVWATWVMVDILNGVRRIVLATADAVEGKKPFQVNHVYKPEA